MNRGSSTTQKTGPYRLPLISPSQLNKFEDCERRWGFNYLLRRWEASSAVAEAGSQYHGQAESYTRYGLLPTLEPAVRAIALAPAPGVAECEVPIRYEMSGVHFIGHTDLAYDWDGPVPDSKAAIKLGKAAPVGSTGTTVIHDWKFTGSLGNAKSANTLKEDAAANIYAWEAFLGGAKRVFCRWVYVETGLKTPKGEVPKTRDLWFELARADVFDKVYELAERGHQIYEARRTRPDIQDLAYNKGHCFAFNRKCEFYDECKPPQGIQITMSEDFKTAMTTQLGTKPPLPKAKPPLPTKKLTTEDAEAIKITKDYLEGQGKDSSYVDKDVSEPEAGFINPKGGPTEAASSPEHALEIQARGTDDLDSMDRDGLKALAFELGLTKKLETKVRDLGLRTMIREHRKLGASQTVQVDPIESGKPGKVVVLSEPKPHYVASTGEVVKVDISAFNQELPEGYGEPGVTLYVDCGPTRNILTFSEIVDAANARLQQTKGVLDYRQISFTGVADLCLTVRDLWEEGAFQTDEIYVSTKSPEGQAILSTLISLCADVIYPRGF